MNPSLATANVLNVTNRNLGELFYFLITTTLVNAQLYHHSLNLSNFRISMPAPSPHPFRMGVSPVVFATSRAPFSGFIGLIRLVCSGFKMIWINAHSVVAFVKDKLVVWTAPIMNKVGNSMRSSRHKLTIVFNLKLAISIFASAREKLPALPKVRHVGRYWTILIDLLPKSFNVRFGESNHDLRFNLIEQQMSI